MTEDQTHEYHELCTYLPIHINKLHEDAQGQAGLAERAGELAAQLKAASKRARLLVDEVVAEVDKAIRADPSKYGLAKITEAVVGNAVAADSQVQDTKKTEIDAALHADKASALSNAFEHRRSMIKIEAELYVHNYWGDPETRERVMAKAEADSKAQDADEFDRKARTARKERRRSQRPAE